MSSYNTKLQARDMANRVHKLLGAQRSGWKIEVWENLGWHFKLRKGCISLYHHFNGGSRYTTLMSTDPNSIGGELYLSTGTKSHTTPLAAIRAQLKIARDHIKKVEKAMELSK